MRIEMWLIYLTLGGMVLYFPVANLLMRFPPTERFFGFLLRLSIADSLLPCLVLATVYALSMRIRKSLRRVKDSEPKTSRGSRGTRIAIIRIGLHYVILLVLTGILCIKLMGTEKILGYASKSKPYSLLMVRLFDLKLLNNPNSVKVFCLGDSNYFSPPDIIAGVGNSKSHLPEMTRNAIGKGAIPQKLEFSQWAFLAAHMYDYYCLYHLAIRYSPDLIIVPINWRMFGEETTNHQLSALVPLRVEFPAGYDNPIRSRGISAMKQLEYKFFLLLSLYPIGIKNWVVDSLNLYSEPDTPNEIGQKPPKEGEFTTASPFGMFEKSNPQMRTGDEPAGRRKQQDGSPIISSSRLLPRRSSFPMEIDSSNRTFRDLRTFAQTVSQGKTRVLFFIWPVNQDRLKEIGAFDEPAFELSKRRIEDATKKENCYFLDLSGLMGQEYFFDARGHCTIAGRKKVARSLAPEVLTILKDSSGAERYPQP